MKIFAGIAVAGLMIVGNAFGAATFIAGNCYTAGNAFGFSNPSPNGVITGTWVCPSFASLETAFGISNSNIVLASEFVNYNSDYSNGEAASVTVVSNYALSGAALAFLSDTLTSTGSGNSSPAVSTDGLTPLNGVNPAIPVGNHLNSGDPTVLLGGFYDNVTGAFGTVTINFTNQATVGSAVQTTGYAQVVYDYNVTSATPEPVSMALFGGGLLALSLIGRKKLARK
jgi:hypothetical protein